MADSTLPSQVQISTSNTPPINPPKYRGITLQKGRWRAQVRSWVHGKTIYIGTYSTPEMAAIAHDVAALACIGKDAHFNFPDVIRYHPVPISTTIIDIRDAATTAAEQFAARHEVANSSEVPSQKIQHECVDENELFNMPQVFIEMAEGLMVSPTRFCPSEAVESPYIFQDDDLWNSEE